MIIVFDEFPHVDCSAITIYWDYWDQSDPSSRGGYPKPISTDDSIGGIIPVMSCTILSPVLS